MKPSRRTFLAVLLAASVVPQTAVSAEATNPVEIVKGIYRRAAAGTGESGGQFLWLKPADRRRAFTASLVDAWAKADKRTPKGDQGPMSFDPVTNSQDPCLKDFRVTEEAAGPANARVVVSMVECGGARPSPADGIVRYLFRRERGQWRIDDIQGAIDGRGWSVREMLARH